MNFLVVCIFAVLAACASADADKNVICYFTSWTTYKWRKNAKYDVSNIDPKLCTQILYGFVGMENNKVVVLDEWEAYGLHAFDELLNLKKVNPKLKILTSMGGWNEGSGKYSKLAADPAARKEFVKNVVDFLKTNKFDGLDLDWEYPGQREGSNPKVDPANFVSLLQELRDALHPEGLLLTIAVAGAAKSIDISYPDVKKVSDAVDMINVMAYDYHGPWESYVGHNAPLYASSKDQTDEQKALNVAAGIEHWLAKGADPKKINLGVGTYGHSFTLTDPNKHDLYDPTIGAGRAGPYTEQDGVLGYHEICELYSDWTEVFDEEQKVPHKYSGNQWVGYDNVESIKLKVQFAKSKGIGGIMVWSLDTDDFNGLCGNGKYPILTAINEELWYGLWILMILMDCVAMENIQF